MVAELPFAELPLSCAEAGQLLAARLDGELGSDAEESIALDGHLAACADCAEQEQSLQQLKRLVHRSAVTPARPELRAALLVALDREAGEGPSSGEPSRVGWLRRPWRPFELVSGVAAAAAIGMVAGLATSRAGHLGPASALFASADPISSPGEGGGRQLLVPVPRLRQRSAQPVQPGLGGAMLQADSDGEPGGAAGGASAWSPGASPGAQLGGALLASASLRPHPLLEDGVALHGGRLPLDFATSDLPRLQRWLASHLDYGVRLPQFGGSAEGPPPALLGARLWTVRSRPAAMVAYGLPDSGGRRISLLIVDAATEEATAGLVGRQQLVGGRDVFLSQARGYTVAAWHHGEVVYSFVSDLDEPDTVRLVARAQRVR